VAANLKASASTTSKLFQEALTVKKKLLAAAVVSAFAAPVAFAQTAPANVTVYGNLQMEIFSLKGDGNGTPDRQRTTNVGTPGTFAIGFRGTESLGGGLNAIWQIEQGAAGDGTGTTNTWGSRNTFLGVSGGFGRVYVGMMDSPFKRILTGITTGGTTRLGITGGQGTVTVLTNGDASGTEAATNTSFSRRVANSVNFDSASFSGFSVSAQYGANEGRSLTSAPTGPNTAVNPSLYSIAANYRGGPFAAGIAWEQHNDFRGAGLDDTAYILAGSWTSGPFLVHGAYSKLEYARAGAGDVKRDNWLIGGVYMMGSHRFRLTYQHANDTKGATAGLVSGIGNVGVFNGSGADTGASIWTANYGFLLSKRTEVYGYYTRLNNDRNGTNNLAGGASLGTLNEAQRRGMDASVFGLGFAHTF
jgi:predicted porin